MTTETNAERFFEIRQKWTDIPYPGLTDEDIEFLYNQAERAQEMEMRYENTGAIFGRRNLMNQIERVEEENSRLRKALEFYADSDNYKLSAEAEKADLTEFINALDTDEGHIARQALKGEFT